MPEQHHVLNAADLKAQDERAANTRPDAGLAMLARGYALPVSPTGKHRSEETFTPDPQLEALLDLKDRDPAAYDALDGTLKIAAGLYLNKKPHTQQQGASR